MSALIERIMWRCIYTDDTWHNMIWRRYFSGDIDGDGERNRVEITYYMKCAHFVSWLKCPHTIRVEITY